VSFSNVALISSVIVIAGFLAGVIVIHLKNKKAGGIIFAATANDFSGAQTFAYQYSPTIMIVSFGIWISILDLDIKRLDPWSRLSGPSGHKSSVLFCRYDSDFILTSVYKAIVAR
jgi:hypothetical protein